MNSPASSASLSRLDRLGMAVSSLCLVHCLALPVLTALLPFFAAELPGDEWIHPLLLGLALPVTGLALLRGWLRHRLARPAALGAAGLAIIASALLAPHGVAESALTVVGGLLVVWAHVLNWRGHRAG
ncbi:MerC domain-containing protein [Altererythrobacter sp. B11]|uniref:MerC domain-containing protein n=1 Tax=Altererythrobacter sp. B11 TaxID=2060312 RepID=UPI0015594B02|nr:MerC domain-containing protein [Altererythrobacter sp. B11]